VFVLKSGFVPTYLDGNYPKPLRLSPRPQPTPFPSTRVNILWTKKTLDRRLSNFAVPIVQG